MLLHEIHRSEDIDIIKIRGLIIVSQMFQDVEPGSGVKDPCAGKETVHKVGVEGDLSAAGNLFKKQADLQVIC
jgi:hypothetical protein